MLVERGAYTLIDRTTGSRWDYDSEAQLKTVARLYALQNPRHTIAVALNGVVHTVRG